MTESPQMHRMKKARSALIYRNFFYGVLALGLKLRETREIETMGTDMRELIFNPDLVDRLSDKELVFVWAHETGHCEAHHHVRRGYRDPELWNIACDHVDNLGLKKAGFDVPDWTYCDAQYAGLAAEQVYRLLAQKQEQAQAQQDEEQDESQDDSDGDGNADPQAGGDEQDGDGSGDGEQAGHDQSDGIQDDQGNGAGDDHGNGGQDSSQPGQDQDGHGSGGSQPGPDSGEPQSHGSSSNGSGGSEDGKIVGQILDASSSPGEAAEIAAEWEQMTRQAINVSKARQPGTMPGWLAEKIKEHDEMSKVDWREALRRFMSSSSQRRSTWSRPNRRFISQGTYLPGWITDGINHLVWILDTSGSMSTAALQVCKVEMQAALDEGIIDKLTVVYCDSIVRGSVEFFRGDSLELEALGRGGTRFSPAFEWVKEHAEDAAAIVYFTDLEVYDFGEEPLMPVMFAAYGDPRALPPLIERVPFGEVITIEW